MTADDPVEWTLVIPAYNEEARIAGILGDIGRFRGSVLFVCDGTDRTAALIREYASRHPEAAIGLIEYGERLGKGCGVMAGMLHATTSLVGFTDADGSTPVEEMNRLFASLGDADGVIGSRWLADSDVRVKQSLFRRFQSRIFNLIVRLLFGLTFHDTQCGAKVFRRAAITGVAPRMHSRGFEFDVELLWRLQQAGFRVVEVPTVWVNRGDSRVKGADVLGMLLSLVRIRVSGGTPPARPDLRPLPPR
jgi:dolichol-phosphate mannosyltransferase